MVAIDDLGNRVVIDVGFVVVAGHFVVESQSDVGLCNGVDDIPHFVFLAAGVNLNRQVVIGIDELDAQGEGVAKFPVNFIAHELFLVLFNEPAQCEAGVVALGDNRFKAVNARYFPTFAHMVNVAGHALESCNLIAAPNDLARDGLELEGL